MKDKIIENILSEYNVDFQGWDFSHLSRYGRMIESELPWNYRNIIEKYHEQLIELHFYIEENGFFDLINHGFLIIAQSDA